MAGHALCKDKRQNPHAKEVGSVDALKAFCNDCFDTQKLGTLGCPVTGAVSYSLPATITRGMPDS